jgi:phenylpyruvate tautomerase PptA (4-oxalocrotonate tautomerase family)
VLARVSTSPARLVVVAEVSVYRIQDVDSDSWTAEMALIAESRQEAFGRLRAGGLHKTKRPKQLGSQWWKPLRALWVAVTEVACNSWTAEVRSARNSSARSREKPLRQTTRSTARSCRFGGKV